MDKLRGIGGGEVLIVSGIAGTGKSTFSAEVVKRRAEFRVAKWHFCRMDEGWTRGSQGAFEGKDFARWLSTSAADSEGPVTVILDGLDEGYRELIDAVTLVIASDTVPKWIRLLITTRSWSLKGPSATVVRLGPGLSEHMEDLERWVHSEPDLSPVAQNWLMSKSYGVFAFVEQALVEEREVLHARVESGELLVGGLGEMIRARAELLWPSARAWSQVVPWLSVAVIIHPAAVEPWMVDGPNKSQVVPCGGPEFWDSTGELFHPAFIEWAVEEGLHGERVSTREGHARLTPRLLENWKTSKYARRKIVHHALNAETPSLVHQVRESVVSDWDWMLSKAELDGWDAVIQDCKAIGGSGARLAKIVQLWSDRGAAAVADGLCMYSESRIVDQLSSGLVIARPMTGKGVDPALEARLRGHKKSVWSVASLGKSQVVSGSGDGTLRIWDVVQEKEVTQVNVPQNVGVRAVAAFPDGSKIVSGSQDHVLRVWNVATGEIEAALENHVWGVYALAVVSPTMFVSGSSDSNVDVWKYRKNAESGEFEWGLGRTLLGHRGGVWSIAVLDQDRIVSAGDDAVIRVWNLSTGRVIGSWEGHHRRVNAVGTLWDGRVVSGSGDCTVRVWPHEMGEGADVILVGHSKGVSALTVLGDGCRVAVGCGDHSVRLWDLSRGDSAGDGGICIGVLRGHKGRVHALAPLGNSSLISGSEDNSVLVWDAWAASGDCSSNGESGEGHGLVMSSIELGDGRIATGTMSMKVVVWAAPLSGDSRAIESVLDVGVHVQTLTPIQDGGFVCGVIRAPLRVWSPNGPNGWHRVGELDVRTRAVLALQDGHELVTGTDTGLVLVWHSRTLAQLGSLMGASSPVVALAQLGPGSVVGADAESLRVWDLETGTLTRSIPHGSPHLTRLVVNQEERLVIGSSSDQQVRFWSLVGGADEGPVSSVELGGPRLLVAAAVAGPDYVLVYPRGGRVVELWSLSRRECARAVVHVEEPIQNVLWNGEKETLIVVGMKEGWIAYQVDTR